MKRLKEIVELLEQIFYLVGGAQDGGPGSGQKGHTTNKPDPNNLDRNDYEFGTPEWLAHAKKVHEKHFAKEQATQKKANWEEENREYRSGKRDIDGKRVR